MNVHCKRGDATSSVYRDCDSCTDAGSPCESSLARLNNSRRHYVVPTATFKNQAPIDDNARGNQALQDYRQMVLLKERVLSNRKLRATSGASVRPRFNNLAPPGPDLRQAGWMKACSLENHRSLRATINDEQDPGEGTSQPT